MRIGTVETVTPNFASARMGCQAVSLGKESLFLKLVVRMQIA